MKHWHRIFFQFLLVLLPTQLGLHFWPEWAMVLGRRVDYLSPTIYLTDILLLLTLVTFIISNLSREAGSRFAGQFLISKQIQIVLLGTLFVAVNIFVATNPMVAVYKWLKVAEFVLLGWYIVRTKPSLSFIVTSLSIGVFYSSILAIAQFVLQRSIGGPLWWLGERTFDADTPGIARIVLNWSLGFGHWDFGLKLRPYATFPHPNVLGGFLAAVLPLIVLRYLSILGNLKKKIKFFYGSVLAVGVFALLLTFSRSAIVVGLFAIVLVLYQKVMIKNRKLKFISYLIVGSALVFILNSQFSILNFQDESIVVRQQLNTAAIKLWAGAPLFGVGLGNFLVRLPEALPTRTIYFLQPVHNIYLLLLSEIGIVGLTFFLWFMWLVVSREWRMENGEWKHKPEFISILYSLFSILLLGLVDHYPLSLQQGQLLLTIVAALCISGIPYEKN